MKPALAIAQTGITSGRRGKFLTSATRQVPLSLMLNGQNGIPIVHSAATIASNVTNGGTLTTVSFTCSTGCAQQGNYTPLFEYADTLSWTQGQTRVQRRRRHPLLVLREATRRPPRRFPKRSAAPGTIRT